MFTPWGGGGGGGGRRGFFCAIRVTIRVCALFQRVRLSLRNEECGDMWSTQHHKQAKAKKPASNVKQATITLFGWELPVIMFSAFAAGATRPAWSSLFGCRPQQVWVCVFGQGLKDNKGLCVCV